jgi:thiol-disulfide isomerase/thioredoxin
MYPVQLKSEHFTVVNGKAKVRPNVFPNKPGMLLIMKKECGHCVRFKPVYKEVAEKIGNVFPVTYIEAADITPQLSSGLDFMGYPTVKFFDRSGNIIKEYDGSRDTTSILRSICDLYHEFCL